MERQKSGKDYCLQKAQERCEIMDYDNIYESLKIIKRTCDYYKLHGLCKECPMNIEDACGVTDLEPNNWKILKPEVKVMG